MPPTAIVRHIVRPIACLTDMIFTNNSRIVCFVFKVFPPAISLGFVVGFRFFAGDLPQAISE